MTKDADDDTWAVALVKRVGRAVKTARDGKSAAWLSDRTDELGYRISPTVIAKLDSGHRGDVLSVAELLILAAALDVPPLVLLYPELPDGVVEVIPGRTGTNWTAYMWATGMAPSFVDPEAAPTKGEQLISAVRERSEAIKELAQIHIESGLYGSDASRKQSLESRRPEVSARINRLNAIIHDAGGVINDA